MKPPHLIAQLLRHLDIKAYLGTYVDDLIAVGPTEEVRALIKKVEIWEECAHTTLLENPGQELKFCGFQVQRTDLEYKLHQRGYIVDLQKF